MSRSDSTRTGVCRRSARSNAVRRHVEALFRVGGVQAHVPGVAVRGVGGRADVALLRARRHAGGRTDPLHVEHHRRNLGVVGESEELLHQRDAGTGGRGERARAVPVGADHHADGGQFVLGLDHHEILAPGGRIDAQAFAEALERVHQRGGRRDRIPGADRGAGVYAAQSRGGVAVDDDLPLGGVHASRGAAAAGT